MDLLLILYEATAFLKVVLYLLRLCQWQIILGYYLLVLG